MPARRLRCFSLFPLGRLKKARDKEVKSYIEGVVRLKMVN